ncbi:hypothetical protein SLEP1_g47637 [Rubroshorea leprosula]|uniref:Uncharacterized protein n=1 Tax=Rubroshorea leprosula TaxID=152421 RepID=A0AAV5LS05_9ROSI|nr:hypothetical protein SLEP1_g47637 [Rubroshorea leprosula]
MSFPPWIPSASSPAKLGFCWLEFWKRNRGRENEGSDELEGSFPADSLSLGGEKGNIHRGMMMAVTGFLAMEDFDLMVEAVGIEEKEWCILAYQSVLLWMVRRHGYLALSTMGEEEGVWLTSGGIGNCFVNGG